MEEARPVRRPWQASREDMLEARNTVVGEVVSNGQIQAMFGGNHSLDTLMGGMWELWKSKKTSWILT